MKVRYSKVLVIILAGLVGASAWAGEGGSKRGHHGKPDNGKPSASGVGTGIGIGGAGGSGGLGGAGGNAAGGSATSAATASAGSASGAFASIGATTFNFVSPAIPAQQQIDTNISGKTTVRQAPDMALMLGSPTSACMNVVGVGGSNAAGGGLVSFSIGVDWCRSFEMARQARNHGMSTLAEDLMCAVEEVKALNSRDCAGARQRADEAAREKAAAETPAPATVKAAFL
ncbi:MAG: hypothetical protein IPG16_02180 [Comamonadaceae bacterium]|nr:hypothetical protein [Comamonadaceae bacterium]